MGNSFQNRLVGSIVFIALIVIFLPDLLDGKKSEYSDQFQTIPNKPKVKAIPIAPDFPESAYDEQMQQAKVQIDNEAPVDHLLENDQSEQVNDNSASEQPKQDKQDKVNSAQSAKKPEPKQAPTQSQFTNAAWVIQLGSFGNKKNVDNLVNKLKREGYVVFTKSVTSSSGRLTKVFIGHDLDKKKLEKMLPALKQLTNLKGKLANYQPAQ